MCYDHLTKFIPASGPLHMLFSQATPVYLCLPFIMLDIYSASIY